MTANSHKARARAYQAANPGTTYPAALRATIKNPEPATLGLNGAHYREQVELLAVLSHRFHELGTQISVLFTRERDGAFGERVRETAVNIRGETSLAECGGMHIQHSAWVRECAKQVQVAARRYDAHVDSGTISTAREHEYERWTDLLARPMTSGIRPELNAIGDTPDLITVLRTLAAESDASAADLRNAFAGVGWNPGMAVALDYVGRELRARASRLAATT